MSDYPAALGEYQAIIDKHKDGIYIDEAYYFAAEIYSKNNEIEKAKAHYEQIIFHHEDSIYFTDARKKFRQLRGDTTL
jgi:tetratricopeptide (TPR) repeat protein